ncbi:core-2/I-branching enzyme-domain-containing protein [Cladochytrium replicatum]|nr:core-2/I-branching enzyme-domain-containing protein [Cladochytrium replicatum]
MEQSDVVLLSSQANQNDVDYLLSTKNAKLNGGELAFSSENDQESMTRTGNEKFADKKLQGAIERLAQLDTESEATSVEDDDKTTVQTGNERGPAVIAKIASTDTATGKNSTLDPYSSPDTSKRKNVKPWAPNIKLVSSRCVLETIYSSGPSTRLWGRPVAARLQGFHVCPQLNGATFNARATIAFPKGWWDDAKSANGKNISFAAVDACEIVELIESSAEGILSRVRQISPGADSKGQARFACYMAADGRNQFISIITGHGGWSRSLLVNVDPAKYFNKTVPHLFDQGVVTQTYMPGGWCDAFVPPDHESVRPADSATQSSNTSLPRLTRRSRHKSFPVDKLLGNVTESTTRLMGRGSTRQPNVHLRRYKLAYLIMAYQDWRNVCALIDRLWDDHVIVAIHIDTNGRRETQLTKQVSLHINTKYPKAKNIYILPNPVPVYWGHSSIVHAELLGLFSLYEKADWDFVINLSEHDYPLRSNAKIYSELKKGPLIPSPKGSQPLSTDRLPNWFRMWHYQPGKEHIARITRPTWLYPKFGVALSDRKLPLRKFPCPKWDLTIKNSQWFAASRPLVEMLRSSQAFANLLAYMEHSYIPDESIFSLILIPPSTMVDRKAQGSHKERSCGGRLVCKEGQYFVTIG